jgi:hypothetical protein
MASVNIPFNLDSRQNGQKDQSFASQRVITNFYAYQDPASGQMPETKIEREVEQKELCFKKSLLILVVVLSSITLCKSCLINCFKLSKNIAHNFQLKNYRKDLKTAKSKIKEKIKINNSFAGMKKIIREEIKALDANEILVRFEN